MSRRGSVSRKIVIAGGRSIVLYSWALSEEPRIRNLVCLDVEDRVVWRAELPASDEPDCFTRVDLEQDAIVAETWRGQRVRLSPGTGMPLHHDDARRVAC